MTEDERNEMIERVAAQGREEMIREFAFHREKRNEFWEEHITDEMLDEYEYKIARDIIYMKDGYLDEEE